MAKVFVKLPIRMTSPGGPARVECEGRTVADALADCVSREPRLATRIFRDDGSVWAGIFVNGRNVRQRDGLDTPLEDGDEVRLLPPIAGG